MYRALLILAALTLTPTALPATTWVVDQGGGGDFTTIGAAVAAALTGDTIVIAAGTYSGAGNTNVDLAGKNLIIRSQSGAAVTIIDCERIGPNTRAFYMHSGEDTTCVIEDLTVLRGYAISGAAIWCDGASPRIVSCRFDSCGVAYGTVRLDNSNARIIDCEFTDCSVFVTGGAVFAANSSPDRPRHDHRRAAPQASTAAGISTTKEAPPPSGTSRSPGASQAATARAPSSRTHRLP